MMETVKQAAMTAISQMPETANIDDIIVVLYQIKAEKQVQNQSVNETESLSCLDLMKDYIGCSEGPEDLSTNHYPWFRRPDTVHIDLVPKNGAGKPARRII
jgi:hypothetical protein